MNNNASKHGTTNKSLHLNKLFYKTAGLRHRKTEGLILMWKYRRILETLDGWNVNFAGRIEIEAALTGRQDFVRGFFVNEIYRRHILL